MIRDNEEGRAYSVRTLEEEEQAIEGYMESLTDAERKALQAILHEMDSGEDGLLEIVGEYRYRREPVGIAQFVDDDYYLGESCQTLYPGVRQALIDLFDTPGYREAVLTGSIGWGKTTMLSVALCYILYQMSCLRSPQLAYGLSPGSQVAISMISKSLPLARDVIKSAVEDKLKISPYFDEVFVPKYGRDVTECPNNIQLAIGSARSSRTLGTNVFAGGIDESNFMQSRGQVIQSTSHDKSVANYDLAEKTYTNLRRRVKSRFMNAGGDLPGMVLLVSSANVENSFTDRIIRENRDNPSMFCRDFATWDVKPSGNFVGDKFEVLVGKGAIRSRILGEDEEAPPDELEKGARVIKVPVEYRDDFERDLEGSIRDVAGISTTAISVFVHRVEKVEEAISPRLKHPFTAREWVYGSPGEFIWERLAKPKKVKRRGHEETQWQAIRRPDVPRHIHVDPALSGDCLGLAMGYVDRQVEVRRRAHDGEVYSEVAPHIVIEFMLRVFPPKGDQIFLGDIRGMIYEIMAHGIPVGSFSCDSYQSADMIQQMEQRGVESKVVSVDRTTNPYDKTKSAFYENRIEMYDYGPFKSEFKSLEYDQSKGKIDHPVAGRKDVADAVAGVVEGVSGMVQHLPDPILTTSDSGSSRMDDDYGWVTGGKVPASMVDRSGNSDTRDRRRDIGKVDLPFSLG